MQAASLKLKLNQTDEALKDFEALLARLNPDSWLYQEINQRIERHYLARNNTPGLSAYLTQWIDKHPQDIEAMLRLGRILSINKQSAEAAAWFNKVIELAPTREDAYLELSQAMQRDGQLATAAATMEKLCGQVTDNVDHIVRWGELVLADTSQPVEARQAKAAEIWRKLLANHVKDQVMLARVAELMRGASRTDEALELYRRAISVDPAQLQYYEYLADYLFKLNRRDEAQKVWDEMASGPAKLWITCFARPKCSRSLAWSRRPWIVWPKRARCVLLSRNVCATSTNSSTHRDSIPRSPKSRWLTSKPPRPTSKAWC